MTAEPPADVVEEAERLTRLARDATGEEAAAYRERRDELLAEYDYRTRVREDDETLVCYPADWVDGGVVDPAAIEDTDRAIERPLGTGDADWTEIAEHNREVARTVATEHGGVHGENATAFAEFMNNHYARRIETAGNREVRRFLDEYFPRNAWPSDAQRDVVEESVRLIFHAVDAEVPPAVRPE